MVSSVYGKGGEDMNTVSLADIGGALGIVVSTIEIIKFLVDIKKSVLVF